jgi:hypothetical protein
MTFPTYPTFPTPPGQSPTTVGGNPRSPDEVNAVIGKHLSDFLAAKVAIDQDARFCAATDLKVSPYNFTGDQEDALKAAVSSLDSALDAIDLTFVMRIVGLA